MWTPTLPKTKECYKVTLIRRNQESAYTSIKAIEKIFRNSHTEK
jgi:hypothetical protein